MDIFLTNNSTKLTVEQTFRLIAEYEVNVCLWNTKSPDYRNRELRAQALSAMADSCNITVAETESYIHSLRTSYGRQLKRIAQTSPSRSAGQQPFTPRWIYFTRLDFLRDVIQPRNRRTQRHHHHNNARIATNVPSCGVQIEFLDECSVTQCSATEWSDDADSVVAVDDDWTPDVDQHPHTNNDNQQQHQHLQSGEQQLPQHMHDHHLITDEASQPEIKHRVTPSPSPPLLPTQPPPPHPASSLTLDASDLCWNANQSVGQQHHAQTSGRTRRSGMASSGADNESVPVRQQPNQDQHQPRLGASSISTAAAAFGQFVGTFLETLPPDDQHRAMLEIHQLLFQIKSGH